MQYDDIAENSISNDYDISYRNRLKELFSAEPDYEPEYVITSGAAVKTYLQPAMSVYFEPAENNSPAIISDGSEPGYEPVYDASEKKSKQRYAASYEEKQAPSGKKSVYKAALFITLCMLTALIAILVSQFYF